MKTKTIYILRLISGDTVCGEYVETTEDQMRFANVLILVEKYLPGGNKALLMDSYDLFAAEDVTNFTKSAIVSHSEASPEVVSYYNASLVYNDVFNDTSFYENITKATDFLWDEVAKAKGSVEIVSTVAAEEVFGDQRTDVVGLRIVSPSSNTVN